MIIETVTLKAINPAKYNPRKDLKPGDPEYESLKRSIDEFGFVEPLVWNKRTGNLVGGHQRFKVLKVRGDKEFTCSVVDLDEAREKALNIALNRISGEWDDDLLAQLLTDLEDEIDLTLTGFTEAEIADLLGRAPEVVAEPEGNLGGNVVIVSFKLSPGQFEDMRQLIDDFAERIGVTPNIQEV